MVILLDPIIIQQPRQIGQMDEHFTNNAEAVYLASLTQAKKILFLQRELANSETYTRNLQQNHQATKLTLNRLIKQRTNNEILAKMSQNLYRMQRKHRQLQQQLKQNNAKLLIEMQLRLQQKSQYTQKIKQLQEQIESIRKTNKDKEQEFTIVVNKLRKYEDIRELMLEDKMGKEKGKLGMREEDREGIIKELAQECNYYKMVVRDGWADVDRKLAVLAYAIESEQNYNMLKEEYKRILDNPAQNQKIQQLIKKSTKPQPHLAGMNSPQKNSAPMPSTSNPHTNLNLNQSTKQLIKHLKKLVISNKILESALNESTQKNQQLLLNNQVLIQANIQLREQLTQYHNKEKSVLTFTRQRNPSMFGPGDDSRTSREFRRSETFGNANMLAVGNSGRGYQVRGSESFNTERDRERERDREGYREVHDDMEVKRNKYMDVPELVREKKLKEYIERMKSKDYDVNVEALYKDVHRMGEFLILSLGPRSKDVNAENKDKVSYMAIIDREKNKIKGTRSISVGAKLAEKQDRPQQKDREGKKDVSNSNKNMRILGNLETSRDKKKKEEDSYELKQEEQEIYIEEY